MRLSLIGVNLMSVSLMCQLRATGKYWGILNKSVIVPNGVRANKQRGSAAAHKRAAKKRNNIRKHK